MSRCDISLKSGCLGQILQQSGTEVMMPGPDLQKRGDEEAMMMCEMELSAVLFPGDRRSEYKLKSENE